MPTEIWAKQPGWIQPNSAQLWEPPWADWPDIEEERYLQEVN